MTVKIAEYFEVMPPNDASLDELTRFAGEINMRLLEISRRMAQLDVFGLAAAYIVGSDGAGNITEGDLANLAGGSNSITITDNGDGTITLSVKVRSDYGLTIDSNGLQLKKQAHLADAAAASAISLGAGADSVDRATFNTDLGTLITEINAIKTVLNNLIGKLESAEVLASA